MVSVRGGGGVHAVHERLATRTCHWDVCCQSLVSNHVHWRGETRPLLA